MDGFQLERWVKSEGLEPVTKVKVDGHEVVFADDDRIHLDSPKYPLGYYLVAWGVKRGKTVIVQPLYIKATDKELMSRSEKGRRQVRLNTALKAARAHLRDGKDGKFYE